jgi:HEAT repeat protein
VTDLEVLLTDLTSGDDVRAEAAVSSLAELGEAALPGLVQLLDSPSRDHRWWAVRALAALDEPAGWLGAIRGLEDPDPSVRQCAALALRHRPVVEAVPALCQALADPDRLTARLAADALGAVGPAATSALVRALISPSPAVRIEAARALADLRDRESIPALFAALDDPSTVVQYWVEEALERMGVGMLFFRP